MASLTRVLQNLFGVSHGTNEVAQFGSLAAGSPQYTDDPALIQALNQFAEGLFSVTGSGSQAPRIEDFNGLLLLLFRQLKYLFQAGIPEWLATENYYSDKSLVTRNGKVYICLTGTDVAPCVNIDPATDNGTNWAIFWAKNNQGSGSGLDADLWDATHRPSGFGNANQSGFSPVTADVLTTLTQVGSAGYFATGSTNTPGGDYYSIICIGGTNSTGAQFLAYGATSGKFYIGNQTAADVITWGYLWNAMNMGSGSGLDSDTVDGKHLSDLVAMFFGASSAGSFGTGDISAVPLESGSFFLGYQVTSLPEAANGRLIRFILDSNTGVDFFITDARDTWVRTLSGGAWGTWGIFWTSAKQGSGSGMDADTVDGKHASDFAPAPATGQTHDYYNVSAVTLDACNVGETRWVSYYNSGSGTNWTLPAGGTYQFLFTSTNKSGEQPGGYNIGNFGGAYGAILYRRIA